MKKRACFVSNSSTSSFFLYGVDIKDEFFKQNINFLEYTEYFLKNLDLEDMKPNIKEQIRKDTLNFISRYYEGDENLFDDFFEDIIISYVEHIPILEFEYGPDEEIYVGLSPQSGKDEETFEQFKDRVKKRVRKIVPDVENLHWINECFHDG